MLSTDHPDAFVSYAREDLELALELRARLEASGHALWMDIDGIPFSASWRERARAGIEAAKAILVVITASWLSSEPCAWELQQAVAAGKKLVPLVLAPDQDPDALPEALRDLRWIPLAQEDETFAVIAATLATDLKWRDKQAELLVAANRWDRTGRRRSGLLRGRELTEADEWLQQHVGDKHQATPTQIDFILAGQRWQRRRLRMGLAGVSVALLLALGLALFAETQRRAAVANERTARSRALAALANEQDGFDPGLATQLALDAFRRGPTEEAQAALRRAALAPPVDVLATGLAGAGSPAISADGTEAAVTSDDGIEFWDLGGQRQAFVLPPGPAVPTLDPNLELTLSPNGRRAAWLDKGAVRVYDLSRRHDLGRVGPPGAGGPVAFDPTGSRLAVALADNIAIVSLGDGAPVVTLRAGRSLPVGDVTADRIVFSHDGRWVAALYESGTVLIWAAEDGATPTTVAKGPPPAQPTKYHVSGLQPLFDMAFSPDNQRLYALAADGEVWSWSRSEGGRGHSIPGPKQTLAEGLSPDGTRVVGTNAEPVVHSVSDVNVFSEVRTWRIGQPSRLDIVDPSAFQPFYNERVDHIVLSDGGRHALTTGISGAVTVWDLTHDEGLNLRSVAPGTQRSTSLTLPSPFGSSHNVAYSPDGARIALVTQTGELTLVALHQGATPARLDTGGSAMVSVAFSHDGRLLAGGGADGTVHLWSTSSGHPLHTLDAALGPAASKQSGGVVREVAFGGTGRLLASAGSDGLIRLWDLQRIRPPIVLHSSDRAVNGIALSPDEESLVSVGISGAVRLWSISRRSARLLGQATPGSKAVMFDPKGTRVALVESGSVEIWSMPESANPVILRAPRYLLYTARFTADGSAIVTVGDDEGPSDGSIHADKLQAAVRIWSPSGLPEGELPLPGLESPVAVGPRGQLVMLDARQTIHVRACEACGPIKDVFAALAAQPHRALSAQEQTLYLLSG